MDHELSAMGEPFNPVDRRPMESRSCGSKCHGMETKASPPFDGFTNKESVALTKN